MNIEKRRRGRKKMTRDEKLKLLEEYENEVFGLGYCAFQYERDFLEDRTINKLREKVKVIRDKIEKEFLGGKND